MSVTVADLLRLPCLREAKVLGGRKGLGKIVSAISVLEYTLADDFQQNLLNGIEFLGGELVITSFANIPDDVGAQCTSLRRLFELGEAGVVLFYVGIVMPHVDKELVKLADSLGFALISMPKKRLLRYSELISEVMEAILKDRMSGARFQADILDRLSRLPVYHRSINTAMRMLADRIRACLILADKSGYILNSAYWPRSLDLDAEAFISGYDESGLYETGGQSFNAYHAALDNTTGAALDLYILTQFDGISDDETRQVVEVLRLSINLWNQGHGDHVLPELVRAILMDEPFKMRRIADAFKVDVASIHNMWVVTCLKDNENAVFGSGEAQTVLSEIKKELSHICRTVVTDVYERNIVAFMDDPVHNVDLTQSAYSLVETLEASRIHALVSSFPDLWDTAQVRRAYLQNHNVISTARYIYPQKKVFTQQEIAFAGTCDSILAQGEAAVQANMAVLNRLLLGKSRNGEELCETLTVYLLDTGCDTEICAQYMFLHRNTIKYRLRRIEELMLCRVGRLPETINLYTAVALRRIMESRKRR